MLSIVCMRDASPRSSTVSTAERSEVACPISCMVYPVFISGTERPSLLHARSNSSQSRSDASDESRHSLAWPCFIAVCAASCPQLSFPALRQMPSMERALSFSTFVHLLFHQVVDLLRNLAVELALKAVGLYRLLRQSALRQT